MAKAVRKRRNPKGTPLPMTLRTASEKAMSVAMGTPHPERVSGAPARSRKVAAGASIPPRAAATGSAARRHSDSSPWWTSRRISIPTTKKKSTIRPSLTNHERERSKAKSPMRIPRGVSHSAK